MARRGPLKTMKVASSSPSRTIPFTPTTLQSRDRKEADLPQPQMLTFNGGLARELVRIAMWRPNTLLVSAPILAEVLRVMQYPHVQERWPLSGEEIQSFVSDLADAAVMVALPSQTPSIVSDPDDDPILQTAITGRADVLCTRDRAFRASAVEVVCAMHGIRVLDDVALIRQLRETPSS